ncbi:carbohydrate ABC transporter membrane protein 2 (CUT1 family) [Kribbella amoyensis]|uniref:Carbohydrate ABC transporter membrane protein 2 (CUT1 family) n=1 Tax=Kribbella amoyensis TaxID=996641 RepID=A0A561BXL2_9ACTN|nr:carbohydrate ABC transporter permease [Kribbella amoyensis]TWD83462.1 carbohydrate ABC transporter membrane protein 2 (CUT1 family) [Kribbella amoyensis]
MKQRRSPLTSVVMLALAAVVGVPLYYIVVNTFKTQAEMTASPLALPTGIFLDNYRHIFETVPLGQSFLNTFLVTAASILTQLFVGSTAAYAMAMRMSRFNRIFGAVLLLGFIVPGQSTLIPLYRMLVDVELVDTLRGLVVIYTGGAIFCYFLIQGYISRLPFEIIEAARIDGAGPFQIYWRIVLPLIRPILVTVGVFQTMWIWNDFITPNVFLSSPEKRTLVLQVYNSVGEFTTDWPAFMTMSVLVLVPMVVFFILTQRHIVSGLLAGSVKS